MISCYERSMTERFVRFLVVRSGFHPPRLNLWGFIKKKDQTSPVRFSCGEVRLKTAPAANTRPGRSGLQSLDRPAARLRGGTFLTTKVENWWGNPHLCDARAAKSPGGFFRTGEAFAWLFKVTRDCRWTSKNNQMGYTERDFGTVQRG
jgi:hypothetical protein